MSVKQARGYYEYAERGGVDSIAFILYDENRNKFALINESKPPRDEIECKLVHMTTAFGGSVDMQASKKEICQIEVAEEAGYEVPLERIHYLGETLVSSQMSQMCHLFLVDVVNIKKTLECETDGSIEGEFVGNSVKWMSYNEVIENCDWKSITIIALANEKMYIRI